MTTIWMTLPLIANICILVPIVSGLSSADGNLSAAYGSDTAARRILNCMYAAIIFSSLFGLVALYKLPIETARIFITTLLAFQIVYKLMTVPVVGLGNPIIVSNLVIALTYTLFLVLAWAGVNA